MSGIPGKGLEFQTAVWNSRPKNIHGRDECLEYQEKVWNSRQLSGIPDRTRRMSGIPGKGLEFQIAVWNSRPKNIHGRDECLEYQEKVWNSRQLSGIPDKKTSMHATNVWNTRKRSGIPDNCLDFQTEKLVWKTRLICWVW